MNASRTIDVLKSLTGMTMTISSKLILEQENHAKAKAIKLNKENQD